MNVIARCRVSTLVENSGRHGDIIFSLLLHLIRPMPLNLLGIVIFNRLIGANDRMLVESELVSSLPVAIVQYNYVI